MTGPIFVRAWNICTPWFAAQSIDKLIDIRTWRPSLIFVVVEKSTTSSSHIGNVKMFEKKKIMTTLSKCFMQFFFLKVSLHCERQRREEVSFVLSFCVSAHQTPSSPSPAAADGSIAAIDPSFFDDGIYDIIFLTAFLRLYRKVQCSKLSDPENLIRL